MPSGPWLTVSSASRSVTMLAINISLAVQILAFSEGGLLAEQGGIDRNVALQVMMNSAVGSPMLQARAAFCANCPTTPGSMWP
jgi:3-hydroxyisobutyrate dehydrogenase-like beta-hydroxyacid dehydrogenase